MTLKEEAIQICLYMFNLSSLCSVILILQSIFYLWTIIVGDSIWIRHAFWNFIYSLELIELIKKKVYWLGLRVTILIPV